MTAKDQTLSLRRAFQLGQSYWADADSESYSANKRADKHREAFEQLCKEQQPAPDCRTCEYFRTQFGNKCGITLYNCTNGDKYQPAPKVVLWRTE